MRSYTSSVRSAPRVAARRVLTLPSSGTRAKTRMRCGGGAIVANIGRSILKRMKQIALLTDFGTRDPYVAAVKGVIASRTDAPVVDLTHDIAPQDVFGIPRRVCPTPEPHNFGRRSYRCGKFVEV